MWFCNKNKYVKCIDCACCNVEKMKCYPNSNDCDREYDLTEDDLTTEEYCDFFISKVNNEK